MGDRRMFSLRVINTARFLKMPVSTQCLYFHLGLRADDDGVVEAYPVLNTIGATEDDLKILVAKDFVKVLNEDLVTYITDWTENNKIRSDRKVDSMYKDLLLQVIPEIELQEKKTRADRVPIVVGDGTSHGRPMDAISKDKLSKDKLSKDKKHKYGEFKHVLLTDKEKDKLLSELGEHKFNLVIKRLDEYIEETGKKYKNHNLTIRRWVIDAVTKENPQTQMKWTDDDASFVIFDPTRDL